AWLRRDVPLEESVCGAAHCGRRCDGLDRFRRMRCRLNHAGAITFLPASDLLAVKRSRTRSRVPRATGTRFCLISQLPAPCMAVVGDACLLAEPIACAPIRGVARLCV